MRNSTKFGFVLVGLLTGIIVAQAMPIFASQRVNDHMGMMEYGHMRSMHHEMASNHMAMMHEMMTQDDFCSTRHLTNNTELCEMDMADGAAIHEQCEDLMATGDHEASVGATETDSVA